MSDAPTKTRTRRQIDADWKRDAVMRKLVALLGPPPPREDRAPFGERAGIAPEPLEAFTIMVTRATRERFERAAGKERLEPAEMMDACLDAVLGSLSRGAASSAPL